MGLMSVPDTSSVSGTSIAWAAILGMIETAEAYSQSPGDIRVLLAPNTAKLFRGREKASGSGFILQGGRIDDVQAFAGAQLDAECVDVDNGHEPGD